MTLVQGDLVSDAYFEALAAEVNEALQEAGALDIGDIAKRFAFAVNKVTDCIDRYLDTTIQGTC